MNTNANKNKKSPKDNKLTLKSTEQLLHRYRNMFPKNQKNKIFIKLESWDSSKETKRQWSRRMAEKIYPFCSAMIKSNSSKNKQKK